MNDSKSFSDDLTNLATEVDADVGSILHVVKATKKPRAANATTENSSEPIANAEPSRLRRRTLKPEVVKTEPLENVTTRLTTATNEKLTEAALHQRLKKVEPDTRQGIIELAVRDWLRKHDYV